MATISPVRTLRTTPAAANALNFARAATSSSRSACCTRRSRASSTGFCSRSVAKPRQVQVVEALPVEPHLHAGDAFVVDIDIAHEVRNFGPVRVGALVFVEEADAGQALAVDFALLLRRDVTLKP